ncbi:MAG: glycine--tRNA ligase subunit alpha [Alphaproteobacteria bacterium]
MLSFQQIINNLQNYWEKKGCLITQPYDLEMGAATFHPATTLRALGQKPWKSVFIQPCRRPSDGRYGKNPNRLQQYYQLQVIIKPSPENCQELYLDSLKSININKEDNDIKFIEDDWESPTLGATGLGWEVQCNGMEISQFTYFQQIGGIDCKPVSLELTYGLERIACFVQNADSVFDIIMNDSGIRYKEIFYENEKQMSAYNFEHAPEEYLFGSFSHFEKNSSNLISKNLPIPAYEQCIKASHSFNLLDSRGLVSATERQAYILRIRSLVQKCCKMILEND